MIGSVTSAGESLLSLQWIKVSSRSKIRVRLTIHVVYDYRTFAWWQLNNLALHLVEAEFLYITTKLEGMVGLQEVLLVYALEVADCFLVVVE